MEKQYYELIYAFFDSVLIRVPLHLFKDQKLFLKTAGSSEVSFEGTSKGGFSGSVKAISDGCDCRLKTPEPSGAGQRNAPMLEIVLR